MSDLDYSPTDDKGAKGKTSDVEIGHIFAETQDVYDEEESNLDPVYQAKARILNDAFQEMGMGKYQVR